MLEYLFESLDVAEAKDNPMETAAASEAYDKLCQLIHALVPDMSADEDFDLMDYVGFVVTEFKRSGFYTGFRTAAALAKEFTDIPEITIKNTKILGKQSEEQ